MHIEDGSLKDMCDSLLSLTTSFNIQEGSTILPSSVFHPAVPDYAADQMDVIASIKNRLKANLELGGLSHPAHHAGRMHRSLPNKISLPGLQWLKAARGYPFLSYTSSVCQRSGRRAASQKRAQYHLLSDLNSGS
jgi:hypothetical protein